MALQVRQKDYESVYCISVFNGWHTETDFQSGSTVAYLSISMLKKLNITVPPIELQTQFAAFVEQVNKSKAAIQKSLDEVQLLFDSLMQQYFG